ncbi:hypothetical protein X975_05029, partial [Stegodyphus mimosarum]
MDSLRSSVQGSLPSLASGHVLRFTSASSFVKYAS